MNALKTFNELSDAHNELVQKEELLNQLLMRIERKEQRIGSLDSKVVDGIFTPLPIDKAAGMLIAKAPWWAFAPHQKDKNMTTDATIKATATPTGAPDSGLLMRDTRSANPGLVGIDIEDLSIQVALAIQRNAPKEMSELARVAVDSRAVLEEATKGIGGIMGDFERTVTAALQGIRSTRMAVVAECASVGNSLKDVRQFFLGPDYEKETKRLSEFVDLCERLQRLKDSGFLDTVADTMIRLSSAIKE